MDMKKIVKNSEDSITISEDKIRDLIDETMQLISLIRVTRNTTKDAQGHLHDEVLREVVSGLNALTNVLIEKARGIEKKLDILIGEPV